MAAVLAVTISAVAIAAPEPTVVAPLEPAGVTVPGVGNALCPGTSQAEHRAYAVKVFSNWQKPLPTARAEARLKRMRANACSVDAAANMRRIVREMRASRPRPPAGTLRHCVLSSESHFSERAGNGSHWNIGQWDVATWLSHRALLPAKVRAKIPTHPRNATYRQAMAVFVHGFARYGCDAWCPFDPC